MLVENNEFDKEAEHSTEDMNTLSSLTTSAVKKGYAENFTVKSGKLHAPAVDKYFGPQEVRIDNFYRFEGASDPGDNAILYCIVTQDGVKGMLIDSYGHGSNSAIGEFIKKVEEIHKVEAEG